MFKLFIFNLLLLGLLPCAGYTQQADTRMELFIIPFDQKVSGRIEHEQVQKKAAVHLTLMSEQYSGQIIALSRHIRNLGPADIRPIGEDYRMKLVINDADSEEVLYFNKTGDFLYKGKTYKNELIKAFVFRHLSEFTKGT